MDSMQGWQTFVGMVQSPITSRIQNFVAPRLLRWNVRSIRRTSDLPNTQSSILAGLVHTLAPTDQGRAKGLDQLARLSGPNLVGTFRERIGISHYGDVSSWIERAARGEEGVLFPGKAVALAQTSGTTTPEGAGERWIPQNPALLAHHARGAMAALDRLLEGESSGIMSGRMVLLGGSSALSRNESGIPFGDLSGITVDRIPWYLDSLYEPGRSIALESDWNIKIERMANRLAHADVTLVSGIPSWMVVLFEAVCHRRGVRHIREAWPRLRGVIHGGISIQPYLPVLREHLPAHTRLLEVYPASEAFLAIGARTWEIEEEEIPDLDLLAANGVWFEFLPDGETDPTRAVGAESLVEGQVYSVLVTTPGGLLRYELGDRVEGRGPGRMRFAGRIKTRISVFGEHVEGVSLIEAIAHACRATHAALSEWHVAPWLPTPGDPRGAHEWWIEFSRPPADPALFAEALDRFLRDHVMDYDAHRQGDVQLLPPRIRAVPSGTFHRTLAALGKLGGQHKVPIAWSDRTWADRLAHHERGDHR